MEIRAATASDYERVIAVLDDWWGGRPMKPMLPRLFLDHFADMSLVAEDDGEVVGFRTPATVAAALPAPCTSASSTTRARKAGASSAASRRR